MSWLEGTRARLRLLFARRAAESRMDEEFQFHIEMETERLMREAGLDAREARRQALVSFGGVAQHKEALRDGRGLGWITGLSLDFKLGFRMLVKYPGLTVVGGFAMAFAILVAAGVFESVKQVIDPVLPVADGERIVGFSYWDRAANQQGFPVPHDLRTWREELATVEDVGGFHLLDRNLIVGGGVGEPVEVAQISAAAFRIARVPPMLGRTLVEADEDPGAPAVVVLGYRLWQTRLGGDSAAVGQVVRLGDIEATVVGIMPEGFAFPIDHSLWMPLRLAELSWEPGQGPRVGAFGRLAPGVTLEEAQAELRTVAARAAADFPERYEHLTPHVLPYAESIIMIPPDLLQRAGIYSINAFTALFLILVCGNVALLMFARAATREREILVRNALGASRIRIVTQLFVEALVLGTLAAMLGLAGTSLGLRWGVDALRGVSDRWPFWLEASLSPTTMTYAGLLTLLAAAIAGVVPALKVTRRGMEARIRQAASGGGLRLGGIWTAVIIAQIAATVVFTALAYVVQRQAARFESGEAEFSAEEYLSVRLEMDQESQTDAAGDTTSESFLQRYVAVVKELERRLATDPAIAGVTVAGQLPMMSHATGFIEVDGGGVAELNPSLPGYRITSATVDLDFFEVFQAPILSGRAFDSRDLVQGVNTVVVNQSFVDQIFGGRSPIGQRIRYIYPPWDQNWDDPREPGRWYEIVGVARDLVREGTSSLQRHTGARFYHPLSPAHPQSYPLHLAAQVRGEPETLAATIGKVAGEVSPTLRLYEIQPLDQARSDEARYWSFLRGLILLVSVIALFLSLAGIYSVMSFTVSRRTREIGVRVALGAQSSRVVAEVFRRPLGHVAVGVVVGCVLVGAMIAFLVEDSGVTDNMVMVGGAALLLAYGITMMGVCALACVGPTLRALRVEPTEALSAEE